MVGYRQTNQKTDTGKTLTRWPVFVDHFSLSWISTRAGTRQYGDFPGAWGWIRLLDKAVVSAYPGTSSSWSLSWKAPDGLLLNYTLRTEAGEGPLALLALRNFTLPETIFSVRASAERVPLTDDIPGEEGY